MRDLLFYLLEKLGMRTKEIIIANNELLSSIAEQLNIELEVIGQFTRESIGGGGIKRPKKG